MVETKSHTMNDEYTCQMNCTNDEVHNPSHYQLEGLGIESVDVIRAVLTEEEFQGWCKGNALKYLMRAGKKDPSKEMQDLEKGGVFISWLTEQE